MLNREQIVDGFTPNVKLKPDEKAALINMEKAFIDLATDIEINAPSCPMRTISLNKLLEAKWACSQAITHPGTHQLGHFPAAVNDGKKKT